MSRRAKKKTHKVCLSFSLKFVNFFTPATQTAGQEEAEEDHFFEEAIWNICQTILGAAKKHKSLTDKSSRTLAIRAQEWNATYESIVRKMKTSGDSLDTSAKEPFGVRGFSGWQEAKR